MRSGVAFSNGSEFDIWQDAWCRRCVKDEAARRDDYEHGCEIIAVALTSNGDIPEWREDESKATWPKVICSAFVEQTGDER